MSDLAEIKDLHRRVHALERRLRYERAPEPPPIFSGDVKAFARDVSLWFTHFDAEPDA